MAGLGYVMVDDCSVCPVCAGSGRCEECQGLGHVEDECPHCNNFGNMRCDNCTTFYGIHDTPGECPECDGSGLAEQDE